MNEKLNDYNYLDIFLSRNKGKSYIKAALRKKAWKAILMDDVSQYQLFMRRIQTEGSENTDEDKQAMFEAKSNIIPNKYLLSSRLYFDGGQYELSLNQLNFIDVITLDLEEKSELYYRKGRCFQRLNKFEEAQNEFNNSIAISRLSNPYIFAVSCFNKAQIYEHLNSKSQAIKYYQMELDTKQHPYKISLDAKSKAALQRLNQP